MSTQRGTSARSVARDRRCKAVDGANALHVKTTTTPPDEDAARPPTDEPTDVPTASGAKKNEISAASAAKAPSRSKRAKGGLTESPTSPERVVEDEDDEMDAVSSGSDEGYIESMIATADSSRGDAKDPDADFSAVLHEVPIEIRRRLASTESGITEPVMDSEELAFCRGCRRTLSVLLNFDSNNKTCRQCLIRQRLKRKRYAARNLEQFGVGRTTEARHEDP
jgi:predicted Fe-S protein YdhL (DUF1289 family)